MSGRVHANVAAICTKLILMASRFCAHVQIAVEGRSWGTIKLLPVLLPLHTHKFYRFYLNNSKPRNVSQDHEKIKIKMSHSFTFIEATRNAAFANITAVGRKKGKKAD